MPRWFTGCVLVLVVSSTSGWAQQAPSPSCETELQALTSALSTRYHELYSDKLILTEHPATTPASQLQGLVQQLRYFHTRFQLTTEDKNRHEGTVAQLGGILRDLQHQVQDLRQQIQTKDAQLAALRTQVRPDQPELTPAAPLDSKEK